MKVNERRTVVGAVVLIGHSTGRRCLSTVGGHTCVPPTVERDRRACLWLPVSLHDIVNN